MDNGVLMSRKKGKIVQALSIRNTNLAESGFMKSGSRSET